MGWRSRVRTWAPGKDGETRPRRTSGSQGYDTRGEPLAFRVPRNLAASSGDERSRWLQALPSVVADVSHRWHLRVGEPFEPGGDTAWVAPARTADNREAVLKLAWRHTEALHEAAGLRVWNGDGAVRVYADDESEDTLVLLLERCVPGEELRTLPEGGQDVVIAGLLQRLWREPPVGHAFRPLQDMCDFWADRFEEDARAAVAIGDPGLVGEGMHLLRTLPASADRNLLLCTDLHAGNVLRSRREPWLMIDPKPYVGDPHYDVLQHMYNCLDRLRTDPRALAERMAGLLDLDAERVLLWLFARCVEESSRRPEFADVARLVAPR